MSMRFLKHNKEKIKRETIPEEGACGSGCCLCSPGFGVMNDVFLKSASGKLSGLGGAGVCFLLIRTACGHFISLYYQRNPR